MVVARVRASLDGPDGADGADCAGVGCAGPDGTPTDGADAGGPATGVDCPALAPEAATHSKSAHGTTGDNIRDMFRNMTSATPRNIARSLFILAKAIRRLCEPLILDLIVSARSWSRGLCSRAYHFGNMAERGGARHGMAPPMARTCHRAGACPTART